MTDLRFFEVYWTTLLQPCMLINVIYWQYIVFSSRHLKIIFILPFFLKKQITFWSDRGYIKFLSCSYFVSLLFLFLSGPWTLKYVHLSPSPLPLPPHTLPEHIHTPVHPPLPCTPPPLWPLPCLQFLSLSSSFSHIQIFINIFFEMYTHKLHKRVQCNYTQISS